MTDTTGQDPERERSTEDKEVAERLVEQAREEGLGLVGPEGVLAGLTRQVLETGWEAELTEHLGYVEHAAEGRDGGNSRNGTREKTVLTEIGLVGLDVAPGSGGLVRASAGQNAPAAPARGGRDGAVANRQGADYRRGGRPPAARCTAPTCHGRPSPRSPTGC